METPKVKKTHPKIGTRMKMSRLQAKAPKKRHTFWKKWKQFLLVIGSIAATNTVVKVTKSIIKPNMIAWCLWNRAAPELGYLNPTRVSRKPKIKPNRASNAVMERISCSLLVLHKEHKMRQFMCNIYRLMVKTMKISAA